MDQQISIGALFLLSLWIGSVADDLEWWQTTIIYEILPRSFKDSNGDGYGDLNGIREKLDYLQDIGIEAILLQPFYDSPMYDLGYDTSDHKSVDAMLGMMEEFEDLVKSIHDRDMKIIIDFLPNHVSIQHVWFRLSETRLEPYTDFFIWADPQVVKHNHTTYPNNWRSCYGGSAWTWSKKRKQYYYHQFDSHEVDLNLRKPEVVEALSNVLQFWLNMNVDGFRINAVPYFVEAEHLNDEPVIPNTDESDYNGLQYVYTREQPENLELTHQWSMLLKEYKNRDGKKRLFCSTEDARIAPCPIWQDTNFGLKMKKLCQNIQAPFYNGLTADTDDKHDAQVWKTRIQEWIFSIPEDCQPSWILGDHYDHRVSTRLDTDSVDAENMLFLLLPGAVNIYYGSEIGLPEIKVRPDQLIQAFGSTPDTFNKKDPARANAPMMWDDTANAGFTTSEYPWLPINPHYWRLNVKTQMQEPNSHLKIFKRLARLRQTPTIKYGEFQIELLSDWVLMLIRNLTTGRAADVIVLIRNFGTETEKICARDIVRSLPETMFVHTGSLNSGYNIGDPVRLSNAREKGCFELRPRAGLVMSVNHGAYLSHSLFLVFLAGCTDFLRKFVIC